VKRCHKERIYEASNPRVYRILLLIKGGSKGWIEYDVKEDRDKGSQRSWKKFRKTQYKMDP